MMQSKLDKSDSLLSPDTVHEVFEFAVSDYSGDLLILESAIGALVVGRLVGWRVLKLAHDQRTLSRYEKILGIKFREVCPDRGYYSHKHVGLKIADSVGDFWSSVRGTKPGRSTHFE